MTNQSITLHTYNFPYLQRFTETLPTMTTVYRCPQTLVKLLAWKHVLALNM